MKEANADENKGRKNKTKPEKLVSSLPALRSYVLSEGLALSFLAAKAKMKAMVTAWCVRGLSTGVRCCC